MQQWSREQGKIQRGRERGMEEEEDLLQNDGQTERSAKEWRISERERKGMKELEEEAQKTREGTTSKCHTSHMVGEVK